MQFMAFMHPYIGRGRATLAIAHDPNDGRSFVGVSYSSPKDNFNRKKGRNIAVQRILKGSYFSFDFIKQEDEFLKEAAHRHFLAFNKMRGPSWAHNSALHQDDMCDNCVTPWKCNGPHSAEVGL